MVHPYNGKLFIVFHTMEYSNKRERIIDTCNLNEFQRRYAEQKKPDTRIYATLFHLYGVLLQMWEECNYKRIAWRVWGSNGTILYSYMC